MRFKIKRTTVEIIDVDIELPESVAKHQAQGLSLLTLDEAARRDLIRALGRSAGHVNEVRASSIDIAVLETEMPGQNYYLPVDL